MASHPDTHCSGCGHDTIDSEEPVFRVRDGHWDETESGSPTWRVGDDVWGVIHRSCFLMAIGDPDSIVAIAQASA